MIEELTAGTYIRAVTERVFEPASMGASGFFAADEVRPDVATGYLPPRSAGAPWRTNVFAVPAVGGPDGGALATAADLDRFLSAYTAGDLVKPPLLKEALRPHARIEEDTDMGYGVYLVGQGRQRTVGAVGADPGAEALVRRFPDLGVNTVVLSNVNGSAWEIDGLVREAVIRSLSTTG